MPPPRQNFGVNALARELGISGAAVSARLKKGQTVEQIRLAIASRTGDQRGPKKTRVWVGNNYVPIKMAEAAAASILAPGRKVSWKHVKAAQPPAVSSVEVDVGSTQVGVGAGVGVDRLNGNGSAHGDDESYNEALRREKIAAANIREIQEEKQRGELVPIVHVNAWFAGVVVKVREMGLRIGPELADRLALTTEPGKCAEMVSVEVRRMLGVLRNMDGTR